MVLAHALMCVSVATSSSVDTHSSYTYTIMLVTCVAMHGLSIVYLVSSSMLFLQISQSSLQTSVQVKEQAKNTDRSSTGEAITL